MVFVSSWSKEEVARLLQLKRDGFPFSEIALTMRKSRAAIGAKLWHLQNPDGKSRAMRIRQERRDAARNAPRRTAYAASNIFDGDWASARPTDEMIAERDARLAAPRTLTGTLFGDPPIGYSALDRK